MGHSKLFSKMAQGAASFAGGYVGGFVCDHLGADENVKNIVKASSAMAAGLTVSVLMADPEEAIETVAENGAEIAANVNT